MSTRYITVNFTPTDKGYAYICEDDSVKVGDICVVESPYDRKNKKSYVTVEVKAIDEDAHAVNASTKHIVCKVDDAEYVARNEKLKQMSVVKAKLDRAVRAAKDRLELKQLADISPEVGKLAAELASLSGEVGDAVYTPSPIGVPIAPDTPKVAKYDPLDDEIPF